MKLNIEINDILYPTLQRISQINGLAPEIYARNIVQVFLEKQYRGEVMDKVKVAKIEDIKNLSEKLKNLNKPNVN